MFRKLPMLQDGWDGDYHDSGSNKTPQDEIIRMAREAGMDIDDEASGFGAIITAEPLDLERFAALVAAHEREACAKVCEENGKEPDDHKTYEGYDEGYQDGSNNCAAAIRARGEK